MIHLRCDTSTILQFEAMDLGTYFHTKMTNLNNVAKKGYPYSYAPAHRNTYIPFPWVRLRRVSHKWSLGTGKTNIRSEGRHQTGQNPDQKLKSTIENDCEVAAHKLCFYTHFCIQIILMKMKYVQLQYLSIKNLIEWHHLVKSARYDIWPG